MINTETQLSFSSALEQEEVNTLSAHSNFFKIGCFSEYEKQLPLTSNGACTPESRVQLQVTSGQRQQHLN